MGGYLHLYVSVSAPFPPPPTRYPVPHTSQVLLRVSSCSNEVGFFFRLWDETFLQQTRKEVASKCRTEQKDLETKAARCEVNRDAIITCAPSGRYSRETRSVINPTGARRDRARRSSARRFG